MMLFLPHEFLRLLRVSYQTTRDALMSPFWQSPAASLCGTYRAALCHFYTIDMAAHKNIIKYDFFHHSYDTVGKFGNFPATQIFRWNLFWWIKNTKELSFLPFQWPIFGHYWFHVKSEWHKNVEIFTLWAILPTVHNMFLENCRQTLSSWVF